MDGKLINPIQDLFIDIEKILDFIEVKDQREFDLYEIDQDMIDDAELWIGAKLENDTYLTYRYLWTIPMFQEIDSTAKFTKIERWMEHPQTVPFKYREHLLQRGRELFLQRYVERNEYVRRLMGLPPMDATEFVFLSKETRSRLKITNDIPIHDLSPLIQNRVVATDEYKQLLEEHPDKPYLKYLGIYKVDPFIVRRSRDFELIRYLPMSRSDINPNLLKEFGSLYNEYREYVMSTLYNKNFEGLYEGYRTFMRLIIQCFVLLQITNKAVEGINSRTFLDDTVLHIILSMHGIPRSLLMTKEVRRTLVVNLLKLTREKATDEVYYNLVRILGYHDIIISKLMLMRGQDFVGEEEAAMFGDDTPIESFEDLDKLIELDEEGDPLQTMRNAPYFIQIDLQDKDPYETIINGNAPVHDYHKITDPDPTWWNLKDTEDILNNSNYSIADSKYIMVEAVIHQIRYLFESIYFTRLILDNKEQTDRFDLSIPELFGTTPMSIYDIMVYLLSATCLNNGLTGEIMSQEQGLLATAGFNFDLDLDLFQHFVETTKYVDREKLLQFIENLSLRGASDIPRLFNEVMHPMREWLEEKITLATNRYEFLEYETIYRSLYTYDISKNSFLDDFKNPIELITQRYGLTEQEMVSYQHFYPRRYEVDPETQIALSMKVEEYVGSRYYPFLGHGHPVTWYLNLEYKGIIYFHDILNSTDVRTIKNADGEFIFLDKYPDGDGGEEFELDRDTLAEVLELIGQIDDEELKRAVFKTDTPLFAGDRIVFNEGDPLPAKLRDGTFKQILIDKITMDCNGLAIPPVTYMEYLYRKNRTLYEILEIDLYNDLFAQFKGGKITFSTAMEPWRSIVMEKTVTIILALENELNMHMKYFEQSVVGSEMFFRPLITLIKHFKSKFVDFAKTGLRYVLGDKIDSGGNSNMFKLFDHMKTTIHFVLLSNRGINAQFGFYDTEHRATHKIILSDRSQMIKLKPDGTFDTTDRKNWMGSIRMVDEVKFFKNGEPIDPNEQSSFFSVGEQGTGRWEDDNNPIIAGYRNQQRITNAPVDTEGWKEFIETKDE